MTDMESSSATGSEELAKELGLSEALTIGIGTMIGAGIFVLPSIAIEASGPGAVFAYLVAGIICMLTANSLAEVATGMPKSGGVYYYVSRTFGTFFGTLAGLSVWLSLTFAVAFYLKGLGEYLALFIPLSATICALAGGIFFTAINYIGAKETGKAQNIIVGILIPIIMGFGIWGAFHVQAENLQPLMPFGITPIMSTTALVFVSFLGFAQIASVAEEIKNPDSTLPLSIIGSVAFVTAMYLPVILVIAGIIPYDRIPFITAPVVEAARTFAGSGGVAAVTFAALLATASSANASLMSSSRINFAMGRDGILPEWLNEIHPKFLTPYRPILATGILTLILVIIADVESLSSSASVLMLLNYGLVNIAVILLRLSPPDNYNPGFRCIGYPLTPILGCIASFALVFGAERFAQVSAAGLVIASIAWFFVWSRSHSDVRGVVIDYLRSIMVDTVDTPEFETATGTEFSFEDDIKQGTFRVLTPTANPESEQSLLALSARLVKGHSSNGEITVMNVVEIPDQAPLNAIQQDSAVWEAVLTAQRQIMQTAIDYGESEKIIINPRVLYSRSKFRTILNAAGEGVDFLVLGWHGSLNRGSIYGSFVNNLVRRAPCPVGVLKSGSKKDLKFNRILVPYRGSEHARLGVKLACHLAEQEDRVGDAEVTMLHVVENEAEIERTEKVRGEIEQLLGDSSIWTFTTRKDDNVVSGISNEIDNNDYDLIVLGASKEWPVHNLLFGSIPDQIAGQTDIPVLMVREYLQEDLRALSEQNNPDQVKSG